jgi:uncharacterized delta-60 repeat protein
MYFTCLPPSVRSLAWRATLGLLLTLASNPVLAQVPDSFAPNPNNPVLALALHPDGSWLAGGSFTIIFGSPRYGLARFEASNSLDPSFSPGSSNPNVNAFNLQPDALLVAGSTFTNLSGLPRQRLARLNLAGVGDIHFNPGANSNVIALATQPDGQIIVGGSFTNLAGQARAYLGRLQPDGSLDATFAPMLNGPVQTLLLQNDGQILLGGEFTTVDGTPRNYLARLNSDGSLDGSFDPDADGPVYCFAQQADERILVGGAFGNLAGQPRLRLARLETSGALDPVFAPAASGEIRAFALQADGKIFVGGNFTNFNGLTRSNLVRLDATGSLDNYVPDPNAAVLSLGLQADGKLLVSGNFAAIGGVNRTRLARLTNDIPAVQSLSLAGTTLTWSRSGSCPEVQRVSFSFSTNGQDWIDLPAPTRMAGGWQLTGVVFTTQPTLRARGEVHGGYHNNSSWWLEASSGPAAISQQPEDQMTLTGVSTRFTVTAAGNGPFWYRWYRNGTLVFTSQNPYYIVPTSVPGVINYEVSVSNAVRAVRSRVAVFWTPGADAFNGNLSGSANAVLPQPDGSLIVAGSLSAIIRFNPNGVYDTTFAVTANGTVNCLSAQPNGSVLAAGSFNSINGTLRNRLARLDAFGQLDPTFNPNASGTVNATVVLADGKILVGGAFLTMGGGSHPYLARLNADGSPDNSFNPFANGIVHSLAVQPDGMILVGGAFTQMNGTTRNRIARLLPDGSLDTSFNPGSAGTAIYSLVVQPDGKILVAGNFTSLGGQFRNRLARLDTSGTVDLAFNPNVNGDIVTLQLQADGRIWVGGSFSSIGGQTRNCLARLNPDGSLDPTIGQNSSSGSIYGLALQGDCKLVAGGAFNSLYSTIRSGLGRVLNNSAATQTLTTDGGSVTWQRNGSSPEIERATFDFCTNGTDWIELPPPARIAGGWQTTGLDVPLGATLRARGHANGGFNNGSTYSTEASSGPPVVNIGPSNLTLGYATTERLTAATAGAGPFAFQWYRNGVLLPNETNSWLNILGINNVYAYDVVVTTPSGILHSQPISYWATGADPLNPNADGTVSVIALQPDGKILLGGEFTNSPGNRLVRLLPNGARDAAFAPVVSGGSVSALAVQANGKIILGGSFTNLNGQTRYALGRLHSDGSLDASFNPGAHGYYGALIACLALQPDGKILVGGWFDTLAGQSRYCLGRLNSDGSLDTGFVPPGRYGLSDYEWGVASVLVEANGELLVFGELKELDPQWTIYAERLAPTGNRMQRLFAVYSPAPQPPRWVRSAVRQPEGGIILGGWFDWIENNQLHRNLARLDANGQLDASFTNSANNSVRSLAVQADGKILVGGWFTNLANQACNGLGRLNADGTWDESFNLGPVGSALVEALAIQPDGRYVVGGSFTNLAGRVRKNIGRLLGPEIATESLQWDGSTVIWQRSALSPEVSPTILESSTDGVTWSYQGDGTRTASGWEWVGVTVPTDAVLRTRGFVTGGPSFWYAESILPTAPPTAPTLLTTPGSLSFSLEGFGLFVEGTLGHLAILEASTNLTQWTAIQTNRLLPPPTFFNDSSATNLPRRFYRARLQ